MDKEKIIGIVLFSLLVLTACSTSDTRLEISPTRTATRNTNQYILPEDYEDAKIVEETQYYKIIQLDFMYYCYIFDENCDVAKTEGPLNKQPHITMVDDHVVKFTFSAGAQLNTQWGYFYDTGMDVFSRNFYSIYDQSNGNVAYGNGKKVIVRDIFDKTKFYIEISSFKQPLSKAVEPISNVEFIDGGEGIKVSYLTGDNYKKVSEVFVLS